MWQRYHGWYASVLYYYTTDENIGTIYADIHEGAWNIGVFEVIERKPVSVLEISLSELYPYC